MSGTEHFDRSGAPISLERWVGLTELHWQDGQADVHEHHLVATEAEASAAHEMLASYLHLLRERAAGSLH